MKTDNEWLVKYRRSTIGQVRKVLRDTKNAEKETRGIWIRTPGDKVENLGQLVTVDTS